MHRDTMKWSWGPLSCHSSASITSCFSIIHPCHKDLYTTPGGWKCPRSSMACILTRCHPLSWFGMLWINMYDSVFQFPPISSNFAQPLKRSGTTFHRPQSITWSTLCERDVSRCMRQVVVLPDTDWFSDPHYFPSLKHVFVYLWPTDTHLYSQSWNP